MNILLATSRGGGIDHRLMKLREEEEEKNRKGEGNHQHTHYHHITPHVKPGATIGDLTNTIRDHLSSHTSTHQDTHVYIMAGVPDITTLHRGNHYRECVYDGTPADTISHIKAQIDSCTHEIQQLGATPIFCTIAPMNISQYNYSFIRDNLTHTHIHKKEYDNMQQAITLIIDTINKYILDNNTQRHLSTPLFDRAINKRHGRGRVAYYRKHWENLRDGVHPSKGEDRKGTKGGKKNKTHDTIRDWAKSLNTAITKNRNHTSKRTHTTISSSSEDEVSSPKRSWKRERRDL